MGDVTAVNSAVITDALDRGYVPVVSTVALGVGADAGESLNVNADTAAAKIAAALGAEKLVLMTDVRGILKNVQDSDSLLKQVAKSDLDALVKDGIVSKGMIPKVDCCRLALDGGVRKAHIIDGRLPHALMVELFTDEGIGTMIE